MDTLELTATTLRNYGITDRNLGKAGVVTIHSFRLRIVKNILFARVTNGAGARTEENRDVLILERVRMISVSPRYAPVFTVDWK